MIQVTGSIFEIGLFLMAVVLIYVIVQVADVVREEADRFLTNKRLREDEDQNDVSL